VRVCYKLREFLREGDGFMSSIGLQGAGEIIGLICSALIVLCFYFTLTFFEHLQKGDERITKQSKIAAISCVGLALIIPILL
jgi:hypothetical protein